MLFINISDFFFQMLSQPFHMFSYNVDILNGFYWIIEVFELDKFIMLGCKHFILRFCLQDPIPKSRMIFKDFLENALLFFYLSLESNRNNNDMLA